MICIEQNNTNEVAQELVASLAKHASISLPLARILARRGIDTEERLDAYLHPSLDDLHDPFLLRDMDLASERILRAVENDESIVVYGDYDADGVTASTVLSGVLRARGANVRVFLPERKEDGYGLHDGSIDRIIEMYHPSLIVTVDCGITAFDEVERAMDMGIDIVVTDHHLCPEVLPPAVACVDPKREDQDYPFDGLAGVGVAAKLVQAMYGTEALAPWMDVIAVGTVADIVPLCDENRAFVSVGLEKLRKNPIIGLRALMEVAGCTKRPINSQDVGFMLAPRINAGGRMASAMLAYDLLNAEEPARAIELAQNLNELNLLRQKIERQIVAEAVERIESGEIDVVQRRMIVLASDDWDDGVVGIVASRLTDRYSRPVLLFSRHKGQLKASGRSIAGVDLHELLAPMEDLFSQFGGHTMAVGLTMDEENLPILIDRLEAELSKYPKDVFLPHAKFDECAQLSWFTQEFIEELSCMEPVGYGNAAPLFLLEGLSPCQISTMGQEGNHLRMQVKSENAMKCAIAFGWGDRSDELSHTPMIDVVTQASLNRWQNRCEVQLHLKAAVSSGDARTWSRYIASTDYTFEDSFYYGIYGYAPDEEMGLASYEEALEEIMAALDDSYQGTFIACNSRDMTMRLLHDLNSYIDDHKLDVCFVAPPADQRKFNTLYLAPDEDALAAMGGYVNTYLFGLPAPGAMFDVFVPDMHLLEESAGQVRKPTKELMGQVFKLLAQRGYGLTRTDAPRRALINWCIDVFSELGFLKVEDERIVFDKSCERRALTMSNAFLCGQNNYTLWMEYLQYVLQQEDMDYDG